ncbi:MULTISPECIES: hypothetical protein [unclassified Enterococcus]|uniref:hypothetical protein n=1 Tax=unclassified Enterococcus TaxID=2608891 RepID=UPI0013ECF702|nr:MULTISPECIES: hypothetical protein [unclassified Enterococcus]
MDYKETEKMEEELLKMMKQKHLKRFSVMQYINEMRLKEKEKACLLGAIKNFKKLKRTYARVESGCQLLLEVNDIKI